MIKVIKRVLPIRENKELENLRATVANQAAIIDYIAAMTDVQIPIEEGENINEQTI